jgi:hypothetical protein
MRTDLEQVDVHVALRLLLLLLLEHAERILLDVVPADAV